MKISKITFPGKAVDSDGKAYFCLGDKIDFTCTVTLGSNESISASYEPRFDVTDIGIGAILKDTVYDYTELEMRIATVNSRDTSAYCYLDLSTGVAASKSYTFDTSAEGVNTELYWPRADRSNVLYEYSTSYTPVVHHNYKEGNEVFPSSNPPKSYTVLQALKYFLDDGGAARRYPMAIGVNLWDTRENSKEEYTHDYYAYKADIGYLLLEREAPKIRCKCYDTNEKVTALFASEGLADRYLANVSSIRFDFSTELDQLDPTLSGSYIFEFKDPVGKVLHKEARSILPGTTLDNTSTSLSLSNYIGRNPIFGGDYTWSFTATDSAGLQTIKTGSFRILPYNKPTIGQFTAERYKLSRDDEGNTISVPSDDGVDVRYSFTGSASWMDGHNEWTLKIVRKDTGGTVHSETGTSEKTWNVLNDVKYSSDTRAYSAKDDIEAELTISDKLYSVNAVVLIPKAGGYLNVEKFGVAVGQRTTATSANKLFEVAPDYSTNLYGGISTVGGGDLCTASQLALGFQCGHISALGNTASGARKDAPVDFETPFADGTVPIVLATFFSTSTAGNFGRCCVSVLDVSSQGFVLRFFNGDASARNPEFQWLAIGQVAAEGVPLAVRPSRPMTANSSQNCVASASSTNSSSFPAWHAFDANLSDCWASNKTETLPWIQLQVPEKLMNISIEVSSRTNATPKAPTSGSVWLSNDGSSFTRFASFSGWNSSLSGGLLGTIDCGNETGYSYIRLEFQNNTGDVICVGNITIRGEIDNS